MADIHIERSHRLGAPDARQAVEKIAREMAERFGLHYWWEQNVLHFQRSGVSGQMEVEESAIRILVKLGLLMRPLRQHINREIDTRLTGLLNSA